MAAVNSYIRSRNGIVHRAACAHATTSVAEQLTWAEGKPPDQIAAHPALADVGHCRQCLSDWPRQGPAETTPSLIVSRRVRELRGRRGWSAKDLADQCAAVGMPGLNRSVLSNLENDRRTRISIEEVLVLAFVLDVSPLTLFLPLDDRDRIDVTPKLQVSAADARSWTRGDAPLADQDSRTYWREVATADGQAIAGTARSDTLATFVRLIVRDEVAKLGIAGQPAATGGIEGGAP